MKLLIAEVTTPPIRFAWLPPSAVKGELIWRRSLPPKRASCSPTSSSTEDIARSRDFYANVLGGEVVSESPAVVAFANSWIIMNTGGGPTDDKPTVTLTTDPNTTSSFLNIRVANIQEIYEDWSAKGAQFLTPQVDHGVELRCYLHDPDGHLIEVGQANRDFLKERGLLE